MGVLRTTQCVIFNVSGPCLDCSCPCAHVQTAQQAAANHNDTGTFSRRRSFRKGCCSQPNTKLLTHSARSIVQTVSKSGDVFASRLRSVCYVCGLAPDWVLPRPVAKTEPTSDPPLRRGRGHRPVRPSAPRSLAVPTYVGKCCRWLLSPIVRRKHGCCNLTGAGIRRSVKVG